MGHRALIAHEHSEGLFDCYRAQWAGEDLSTGDRFAPGQSPVTLPDVDPTPVARALDRREVYARIDWLAHEALFVVPQDGPVEAYLPVPLRVEPGVPGQVTASGPGLLVAPTDGDRAGRELRARIEGARAVLRELVERGSVDEGAASGALVAVAREWGATVIAPE